MIYPKNKLQNLIVFTQIILKLVCLVLWGQYSNFSILIPHSLLENKIGPCGSCEEQELLTIGLNPSAMHSITLDGFINQAGKSKIYDALELTSIFFTHSNCTWNICLYGHGERLPDNLKKHELAAAEACEFEILIRFFLNEITTFLFYLNSCFGAGDVHLFIKNEYEQRVNKNKMLIVTAATTDQVILFPKSWLFNLESKHPTFYCEDKPHPRMLPFPPVLSEEEIDKQNRRNYNTCNFSVCSNTNSLISNLSLFVCAQRFSSFFNKIEYIFSQSSNSVTQLQEKLSQAIQEITPRTNPIDLFVCASGIPSFYVDGLTHFEGLDTAHFSVTSLTDDKICDSSNQGIAITNKQALLVHTTKCVSNQITIDASLLCFIYCTPQITDYQFDHIIFPGSDLKQVIHCLAGLSSIYEKKCHIKKLVCKNHPDFFQALGTSDAIITLNNVTITRPFGQESWRAYTMYSHNGCMQFTHQARQFNLVFYFRGFKWNSHAT